MALSGPCLAPGNVEAMRIIVENNSEKWIGLSLVLTPAEIDGLIRQLTELGAAPDQHFHISKNGDDGPFVDLEISVHVDKKQGSNAFHSGLAIQPDDPV